MSARESSAVMRALKLVMHGASPAKAARMAGCNPSSVYRAMKRHGVECTGTPGRKPRRR
jgi:transposase-like protein